MSHEPVATAASSRIAPVLPWIAGALAAAALAAVVAACGESRRATETVEPAGHGLLIAFGLERDGMDLETHDAIVLRSADMGAESAAARRTDACPAAKRGRVPQQGRSGAFTAPFGRVCLPGTAETGPAGGWNEDEAYGAATIAATVRRLEVRDPGTAARR